MEYDLIEPFLMILAAFIGAIFGGPDARKKFAEKVKKIFNKTEEKDSEDGTA